MPRALLLVYNRTEAVLTVAIINNVICNEWEINPKYKKVLS